MHTRATTNATFPCSDFVPGILEYPHSRLHPFKESLRAGWPHGRGGFALGPGAEWAELHEPFPFHLVSDFLNVAAVLVQVDAVDDIFLGVEVWHVHVVPQFSSVHSVCNKMLQGQINKITNSLSALLVRYAFGRCLQQFCQKYLNHLICREKKSRFNLNLFAKKLKVTKKYDNSTYVFKVSTCLVPPH